MKISMTDSAVTHLVRAIACGSVRRPIGRRRCVLIRRLVPAALMVIALGGTVTGCDSASSCMQPFLRLRVAGRSYAQGTCAGQYSMIGPLTVTVGQRVTAEIPDGVRLSPAWPLPVSSDSGVVRLTSRSADGRREGFTTIAEGRAMLDVWGFYCPFTPSPAVSRTDGRSSPPPTVPRHRCHILALHVVR
jgi:hypothetical protein